jgi:WD40 repeat protein
VETTKPPNLTTSLPHDDWISSICINSQSVIATGSFDSFVRVWDTTGNLVASASSSKFGIKSVHWINDSLMAAGDAQNNIYGFKAYYANAG